MNKSWCRGFSLLEILIVMAILAIIAAAGSGFYLNYNKNVEIKSIAETLLFDLKQTQAKSMVGENDSTGASVKWGIHFVNPLSGLDYYEIFSTPTDYANAAKKITTTKYLSSSIVFSDPATNSVKDIIFQRIKGGIDTSSTGAGLVDIPVILQSGTSSKTITTTLIGNLSA